ncbi:hypothetical protein DNTS_033265 [Danionella cerebrum]|uniref:Uncharacterized protein n=1 Tax=Danionella cerebrum TaxID=2873325 RepID=A0A553RL35_9TELE|nr:hypothetical protein DNTS_033265 [Danionella translucida]
MTLKRKEKEYEHEMERLAREKIATQQRLAELKNELSQAIDVLEINRILRQTVQPDDDQASTSTASEGEDNFNQDAEDNLSSPPSSSSAPKPPLPVPPEPRAAILPPTILSQHISIQHKPTVAPMPTTTAPHIIAPAPPQPTVITHASVIHAGPKHLAHIAPSTASPIGHITVHPVTHLPTAIYQQPVGVGHITHALAHHQHAHGQVNGMPSPSQQTAVVGKPTTVLAHHHHTGLVGQTVLNPVTMVTVPQFPVGTLKLA